MFEKPFMVVSVCNFVIRVALSSCSIAECFAFLVCTKWSNPMIHRSSCTVENAASSSTISYLDWTSGLVVFPEEDQNQETLCALPDIGGHFMKVPIIAFQILLCMRLEVNVLCGILSFLLGKVNEQTNNISWYLNIGFFFQGTPSGAKDMSIPVLFSPLFLLQGVGVLFAISRLVEKFFLLLRSDAGQWRYFTISAKLCDCLAFMHHGSR